MRSKNEQPEDRAPGLSDQSSYYREMRLLNEVESYPNVSQRELAGRLGIALGMTNLILHSLVQRGYIRMSKAGWKRWMYALTPEGFLRKVQLTLAYIHRFVDQYRKVRDTLRNELALEQLNAESRVAMYGAGEFAELVYLGLRDLGIEEIEVFEADPDVGAKFLGMRVQDINNFQETRFDRVVIAVLGETEQQYAQLTNVGAPKEKMVFLLSGNGRAVMPSKKAGEA